MKQLRPLLAALGLLLAGPALAQIAPPVAAPLDVAAVDAVVARTLKVFDVPGVAVAVVKDGQVVMAKGYGVSSKPRPRWMPTRSLALPLIPRLLRPPR